MRANHISSKHRAKSGVAILGAPLKQFETDLKSQGHIKLHAIRHGEQTASAALASDRSIVDVSRTPRNEQTNYSGRSQYLIFKYKPVMKSNHKGVSSICSGMI